MVPLCWFILLLCLSANAENIAVYRESGENVTLECSSAGCPSSIEAYSGMYQYHDYKEREEVFFYYSIPGSPDKITPRERYKNRIQTNGSLKNLSVTINNLTVDDSGFHSCVYKNIAIGELQCNVYTLLVIGVAPCYRSEIVPLAPANEKTLTLVLIIIAACAISTLVTMIFILVIVPRVKQCTCSRRTTTVPQTSNDYLYEVMTKNGLCPSATPS
ncbi:uncharacterized protein si:rp71-81e14.2 [Siniperca chuatsi]|uniref:uncharacterized protein si:rp71-81e14.2 n=1 Tax=Siniperca chuatsi TaxID=119488 RepID=UPI001CE08369|nr:uncharacterized protein si:rp71-81e14.2 [Siniperca chuatsi]